MNLKKVDLLAWLKDQEDWALFEMSCPAKLKDDEEFLRGELQTIRDIKAIVTKSEVEDE